MAVGHINPVNVPWLDKGQILDVLGVNKIHVMNVKSE